jgi:predicted short-subunit dehydrogenase-like oxidoreductase (DUF2520 family)
MGKKIAIIGAGNLGTRVSLELCNQGVEIIQIYSRTVTSALTLGKLIGCSYVTNPEKITPDADIYLISVSDLALSELLREVNFNNKLVAHTAGSIPMEELKKYSNNFGVFYPLQTFSKYREVDFSQVPLCIEGNTPENEQILVDLASIISNDVRIISSGQRKELHLAAVFAANFVNHLYSIAAEIVQQNNLPFDILLPLISETASKIKNMTPLEAQTGSAVRNDKNIINEHLDMLNHNPNLKKIYSTLSEDIYKYHKNKLKE